MLLLIIIAYLLHTGTPGRDVADKQWLVSARSKLEISGKTNVNRFHCLSTHYAGSDTLTEYVDRKTSSSVLAGVVTLMTSDFDCHNEMITRDFKETLKADDYPRLNIRFIELKKKHGHKGDLNGIVEITLAGTSKKYPVTCMIKSAGNNEQHLEGIRTFKFSDFGLRPPNKLFGAIKAEDKVSVIFHLRLTSIIAKNDTDKEIGSVH
jgi:hypothetical protein